MSEGLGETWRKKGGRLLCAGRCSDPRARVASLRRIIFVAVTRVGFYRA